MSRVETGSGHVEESEVVAAIRAGDASAFGGLAERHRRERQVHCNRMLGSFEHSKDLVQKTFLPSCTAIATPLPAPFAVGFGLPRGR